MYLISSSSLSIDKNLIKICNKSYKTLIKKIIIITTIIIITIIIIIIMVIMDIIIMIIPKDQFIMSTNDRTNNLPSGVSCSPKTLTQNPSSPNTNVYYLSYKLVLETQVSMAITMGISILEAISETIRQIVWELLGAMDKLILVEGLMEEEELLVWEVLIYDDFNISYYLIKYHI
jgi:hypothetical protein